MKSISQLLLAFAAAGVCTLPAANWPAWRGPTADGISTEKGLPVKWSKTENVAWRVELPEAGNSTPIVWGDRIFLTQSVGDRRTLMCLSRKDGALLWQQGVTTKVKEPTHQTNPYCSGSPVTDGECVIVWFGTDGLHCYDLNGKLQWSRDLGVQRHIWGYGSSPVIRGDLCYLNFGPGESSFLIALDKKTGKDVWRHDEETGYGKPPTADVKGAKAGQAATYIGSWTTPYFAKVDGKDQLLVSWPRHLVAYDPKNGSELWECSGLNPLVYTSPMQSGDMIVSMGGFGGSAIAVKTGGSGDITSSGRVWMQPRSPQRIGSGVIHDGHIYIHNDPGTAMCIDLKTGANVWTETLAGTAPTKQNWSSIMLADGNCYTITQGGDCFVFKASPKFELVSVNPLGERSNSSVVPSNGQLFIRTHKALWCIGRK